MPGTLIDVIGVRIAPGVPATRLPLASEWITVTNRCRATDINRGRDHELTRTQAGTATVVLDDRDRELDPVNTAGPYYPDLQPMMWIEISYDTTVKFTGYVERFDVSWPGGPYAANRGDAITTITAVDVFKLASLGDLVSFPSTVLTDGPVGYWRLNEIASPAINIGSQQDAGVAGMGFNLSATPGTVSFGSLGGPLGNNKTVADFVGSPNVWPLYQSLIRTASSSAGPALPWTAFQVYQTGARVGYQGNIYVAKLTNQGYPPFDSPSVWTWVPTDLGATGTIWHPGAFEMWLDPRTLIPDTGIAGLYEYTAWPGTTSAVPWRIDIDSGGALRMEWSGIGFGGFAGALVRTTPSPANLLIANGGWQHIIANVDGSVVTWYRNGQFFGSSSAPVASTSQEYNLNLAVLTIGANNNPGLGYDGRMAHFALFPNRLSASRIVAHITSTADTVEEGLSGTQVNSLLDALQIPANMRDIDLGASVMQAFEPSGSALDQLLHIAEDSERGVFIASPNGKFKFIDRNTVMGQVEPVVTFGDAGLTLVSTDGYGVARYGVGLYGSFIAIDSEIGYVDLDLTEADEDLKTLVSVTRQNGVEQVAWDEVISSLKGVRTLSISGLSLASDADAAAAAGYLLARFRLSHQRPRELTILGSNPLKKAQISSRDVVDRITVVRRPPGGGAPISTDTIIEGVRHSWAVGRPWATTYRQDLPTDTGTWVVGTSTLGTETVLGWGDVEPEGTGWLDIDPFEDGNRMTLKDYSVLVRRDPKMVGKAHAVRYYYPASLFSPSPIPGTPEIQRIKFRNGTATGGSFVLTRPAVARSVTINWNDAPSTVQAACFRTIPRGGGPTLYGSGEGTVTQAAISTPLNRGGFIITFSNGISQITSVGVDSTLLLGDSVSAVVTLEGGFQTTVQINSNANLLNGGTFQLLLDGEPSAPIPWNVGEPALLDIVQDIPMPPTTQVTLKAAGAPQGLKDGYDFTVNGLGDLPLLVADSSLLIGDTVDVIPIKDGDMTFTSIMLMHGDSYGRFVNTDGIAYPMNLGKLPGRWWLHGQIGFFAFAFSNGSGFPNVMIRRNGFEILAVGGPPNEVVAGYYVSTEVTTEITVVDDDDYIELGFGDPNMIPYLQRGSENTFLEAVWMGE